MSLKIALYETYIVGTSNFDTESTQSSWANQNFIWVSLILYHSSAFVIMSSKMVGDLKLSK